MRTYYFLIFIMFLTFFSCSKHIEDDFVYGDKYLQNLDIDKFNDKTAIEVGESLGKFIDALMNEGNYKYKINNLTRENFVDTTSKVYGINRLIVKNYFEVMSNNQEYISKKENKRKLIIGLYIYAKKSNYREIDKRWLFATIANIMDVEKCSFWNIAAGVVDTAVLGAATVVSGATGIGAVVGGVSTASAYANTLDTAIDCLEN